MIYPELLRQHLKIMLQNRDHLRCRWHQQGSQWWQLHHQGLVHAEFFQTQRWAFDVELGPTKAESARAQITNCSCERTACCEEAAAALLAALTWLCTCTNWTICLKSLSLLSYNKAFFLGELLLEESRFCNSSYVISSKLVFSQLNSDEIIIQIVSQSS